MSADFVIYISKDSGLSFQYLPIQAHVEIHCLFPIVTFLVNATTYSNQHKMLFVQYSFLDDTWEEKGFQLSGFIHGPPVSFTFAPPSSQFVVVWSQKTIAFGRLDETGIFLTVKGHGNLTDFTLGNNETMKSVIPGGNGEFAVHLSNNRIFYGKAFIQHMVEVFAGEDPSSTMAVMFDVFGSLLVITNNNGTVYTRKLPLGNEILNGLYPHTSCPFLKFTTSARPELHFIDKGNELKVWALLIHPRVTPNDIRLEISSSDVLRIETEDIIEHYPGIVTLNKTYTFIHDLRNGTANPGSAYKSTVVSVTMFPSVRELTCENDLQVLHINVGCPPSKTIVIRNCTVPSGEGPVPYLSQVQGLSEPLACHLTTVVSESFKLVLDMYEKDRFVQEVHTDYVVWEETGRADYRYTATMTEAGCLKEAQSWRRMTTNISGETTNLWTQNNYHSSFEPDPSDKSFDGSQPYEILNSSGIFQLVFLGSGLFRFQLRVVGAHFSFCELTTRFSVEVTSTDEAKEFLPQLVSILVVTLSSTVLLYISFAHYTKKTLHRHQEDEEEQQRLQELRSLFSSLSARSR
ncbi:unnamed protein product [Porites lobata]|uniref:Uncharacterized protein n=1 Tax=Porites lobata TaxID=104759 RepID=A0ABN8PNZ7_9CNID|nr:unnamed protein product [Porites lobata]